MKIFRSLVVTAAAFCSFGSMAALMTFTPAEFGTVSNTESGWWRDVGQIKNRDSDKVTISFDNPELYYDSGIEQDIESLCCINNPPLMRMLRFRGNVEFSGDAFTTRLCTIAGLQPDLCKSSNMSSMLATAMWAKSVNSSFWSYLYPVYSVIHGNDQIKYTKVSISHNIFLSQKNANTPWVSNLQIPNNNELLAWLKNSTVNQYRVTLSVEKYSCSMIDSTCQTDEKSTSYSIQAGGTVSWQTETVPLPATASFLLLGLTGLALRRRLTA